MYNEGIPVSQFTETLLKSRTDDIRIDMIHELMFGDDIGGLFKERKVTLVDKDEKPVDTVIRKAGYLDTLAYLKTPGDSIKTAIEQNVMNVAALRNNSEGLKNSLPPIKDVWLFVFFLENDEIKINTYANPNSADIGEIMRTDKQIIMTCFIIVYPTVFPGEKLPEGYPEEVYEWTFISPIIEDHLTEYSKLAAKFEAKRLEKMFFLDFKKGLDEVCDQLDASEKLKNI